MSSVPKKFIDIIRKRGEDDSAYADRLRAAMDKNSGCEYEFRRHLRPKDREFLREFDLSNQRLLLIKAGGRFDGALFDRDLASARVSLLSIARYFEGERSDNLDYAAFCILKAMTQVPEDSFNEYVDRNFDYLQFTQKSFSVLISSKNKGLDRVRAAEEIYDSRRKKNLDEIWPKVVHEWEQHALYNPYRILEWGEPEAVLEYLIEKDSVLLDAGLFNATKLVNALEDMQESNGTLSREFERYLHGESGRPVAVVLRSLVKRHISAGHPREELLASCLSDMDKVMNSQISRLDRQIAGLQDVRTAALRLWDAF